MEQNPQAAIELLIPSILLTKYKDITLVSEATYFKAFQATHSQDGKQYTILAFDRESPFSKQNPQDAFTIFWQQCMYICCHLPANLRHVKLEDCITAENNQAVFVMEAHTQLDTTSFLQSVDGQQTSDIGDLTKLLQDVSRDVDFLLTRKMSRRSASQPPKHLLEQGKQDSLLARLATEAAPILDRALLQDLLLPTVFTKRTRSQTGTSLHSHRGMTQMLLLPLPLI